MQEDVAFMSEFYGVTDYVHDDLLQSIRVRVDKLRHIIIEFGPELQVFHLALDAQTFNDLVNQLSNVVCAILKLKSI